MGGASLPGDYAWESGAAGGGPIHSSAFPAVAWAFLSLTALRNCGSCGFHRIHLTQIVEMWRCFLVSDLNVPRSRHPALPPPPPRRPHVQNSGGAWVSGTHRFFGGTGGVKELKLIETPNTGR